MPKFLIDTETVKRRHQIVREMKVIKTKKGYFYPLQTLVYDSFSAIECPLMPLEPPKVFSSYPPISQIVEKPEPVKEFTLPPISQSSFSSILEVKQAVKSARTSPKQDKLKLNIVISSPSGEKLNSPRLRQKSPFLEPKVQSRPRSRQKYLDTFVLPPPESADLAKLDKLDGKRRNVMTQFIENDAAFGSILDQEENTVKLTLDFIEMFTTIALLYRQQATGIQSKMHVFDIAKILQNPKDSIIDLCHLFCSFVYNFSAKDGFRPLISSDLSETIAKFASKMQFDDIKKALKELSPEKQSMLMIITWYTWYLVFLLPNQSWYERMLENLAPFVIAGESACIKSRPMELKATFNLPSYQKKILPVSENWVFHTTKTQTANYVFAFFVEYCNLITE